MQIFGLRGRTNTTTQVPSRWKRRTHSGRAVVYAVSSMAVERPLSLQTGSLELGRRIPGVDLPSGLMVWTLRNCDVPSRGI